MVHQCPDPERLLALADPASIAAVPAARWPALSAHHQVVVLLLTDPLEIAPPEALLAFAAGDGSEGRAHLDLAAAAQRRRWHEAFAGQVDATVSALAARGVHALPLSCDAPSDSWLAPGAAGRG